MQTDMRIQNVCALRTALQSTIKGKLHKWGLEPNNQPCFVDYISDGRKLVQTA